MSRISNAARAGLAAGTLSLLMSHTALASVVNVHVPVPVVHVSVPVAPIGVKTPVIRTTVIGVKAAQGWHGQRGGGVQASASGIAVYGATVPTGHKGSGNQTPSSGIAVYGTAIPAGAGVTEATGCATCDVPRQIGTYNATVPSGVGTLGNYIPPYQGLIFTGFSCVLGHSTGGGDHAIAITKQSGNTITVTWQGDQNGQLKGSPKTETGTITENPNGSYTITFSWTDGSGDTNTYTGTLTPQGGGSWYLSGDVTVTTPAGQPVAGMGPGISSCLYVSPTLAIPEG